MACFIMSLARAQRFTICRTCSSSSRFRIRRKLHNSGKLNASHCGGETFHIKVSCMYSSYIDFSAFIDSFITWINLSEPNRNLHLLPRSHSPLKPDPRLFHWGQHTSAGRGDTRHQTVYACTLGIKGNKIKRFIIKHFVN